MDANVWFSAARSHTGSSFLLDQLARRGIVKLYANSHVLDEAQRNLLLKSPADLAAFHSILVHNPLVNNTQEYIIKSI